MLTLASIAGRLQRLLQGSGGKESCAYADEATDAVKLARTEAFRLHHGYIEPRHLLLALLKGETSLTPLLDQLSADREKLIRQLEGGLSKHSAHLVSYPNVPKPLTSRTQWALEQAAREARQLGHDAVDCRHLFLGVLRDRRSSAVIAMGANGITYERAIKRPWALQQPELKVTAR